MDSEDPAGHTADRDSPGSFADRLRSTGRFPLHAREIGTLQLNITRACNLSCRHCHVEAGPSRARHMDDDVLDRCLAIANHPAIHTLDITGGAPELHPRFRELVAGFHATGKRLLVRSNLVILLEPPFEDLPRFYADHGVELVGSLPDVRGDRTDRQRGEGTFRGVIEAIRRLNRLGYAAGEGAPVLDLVHNPAGAYLPGEQAAMEADYRRVLRETHGVAFSRLFCLTNCPVGRYLGYLERSGNLADYMRSLRNAYNPAAADRVMCRTTLSVAPDGSLYDCDFNQMLGLTVDSGAPTSIFEFDYTLLAERRVVVRDHCYACTAGAGSSCQGVTTAG